MGLQGIELWVLGDAYVLFSHRVKTGWQKFLWPRKWVESKLCPAPRPGGPPAPRAAGLIWTSFTCVPGVYFKKHFLPPVCVVRDIYCFFSYTTTIINLRDSSSSSDLPGFALPEILVQVHRLEVDTRPLAAESQPDETELFTPGPEFLWVVIKEKSLLLLRVVRDSMGNWNLAGKWEAAQK